MDNVQLLQAVKEITDDVRRQSPGSLPACRVRHLRQHRRFASMYPKLFTMCFEPNFDFSQFGLMMRQLDDIQSQRMSLEAGTSNVHVHLTERYVVPVLNSCSNADSNAMGNGPVPAPTLTVRGPDGSVHTQSLA